MQPDNFTPARRTPWGGTRIAALKSGDSAPITTGESWEISVGPEFPSALADGRDLAEVLAADAERMLGTEAALGTTRMLVKLLDSAQPLSLQIHPPDDYTRLRPDEGGKPECWYVVAHAPGAGLYLGLAEGTDETALREVINNRGDVAAHLHFVEVQVGDCFVIEPGTPHAVGAGIFLVEPQRVEPGKRGVTYRYWDWNRRYDLEGNPHPAGQQRTLHLEDALAVTRWDAPRGRRLIERIHHAAGGVALHADAHLQRLVHAEGPLTSAHFELSRLSGTGRYALHPASRLRGLVVLHGSLVFEQDDGLTLRAGQSAVLPAALPVTQITMEAAHALIVSVT